MANDGSRAGLETTDSHGKTVRYRGVGFEGSPRTVFWGGFFEPFILAAARQSLQWVIESCRERSLDPSEYLSEARALVGLLVEAVYDDMVQIDQALRGKGYPSSVTPVEVSQKVEAMKSQVDDLLTALTHRGKHPPTFSEMIAASSSAGRDVFLCHASTDKEAYVRPLAAALSRTGITYWLDEAEIGWGDRITEKINTGLASSRYVVVFLTETFLGRHWPQAELGSALSLEASTGGVVVLPIMVASEAKVFVSYPLLRDKHYVRWGDGLELLVNTLKRKLGIEYKASWGFCHPAAYSGQVWIHIIAEPDNRGTPHDCRVRWGPWERQATLNFDGRESAFLVHMKGDDGVSVPIFLDLSPSCYAVFGQGEPPGEPRHDINHRWHRIETV